MKKAIIAISILLIAAAPAAAKIKCSIAGFTLYRSISGKNEADIKWRCSKPHGTETIDRKEILGRTTGGRTIKAKGTTYIWAEHGKTTRVKFKKTGSPLEKVFRRRQK